MAFVFDSIPRGFTLPPELRDWLLDSPVLRGVSSLVLDAASCGLIDLRHSLATAVAVEARLQTLDYPAPRSGGRLPGHHWYKRRRSPARVRIDGGVALLAGTIAENVAKISQTARQAKIHLLTEMPETIVMALPGRPISALVSSPLLDARVRIITSAETTLYGMEVTFDVAVVPITRIRPILSRGFAARPVRNPARSR